MWDDRMSEEVFENIIFAVTNLLPASVEIRGKILESKCYQRIQALGNHYKSDRIDEGMSYLLCNCLENSKDSILDYKTACNILKRLVQLCQNDVNEKCQIVYETMYGIHYFLSNCGTEDHKRMKFVYSLQCVKLIEKYISTPHSSLHSIVSMLATQLSEYPETEIEHLASPKICSEMISQLKNGNTEESKINAMKFIFNMVANGTKTGDAVIRNDVEVFNEVQSNLMPMSSNALMEVSVRFIRVFFTYWNSYQQRVNVLRENYQVNAVI